TKSRRKPLLFRVFVSSWLHWVQSAMVKTSVLATFFTGSSAERHTARLRSPPHARLDPHERRRATQFTSSRSAESFTNAFALRKFTKLHRRRATQSIRTKPSVRTGSS